MFKMLLFTVQKDASTLNTMHRSMRTRSLLSFLIFDLRYAVVS